MDRILFIARDDAHHIHKNVMAKIFMTLLITIPLFFTWFNVLATWNPFDNSDQLKIAVANTDEGYTSDVLRFTVNVGDIVLKELAANDQLDWVIEDEESALEGTRSGEYYAAIVLPEDFSESMFTFYAGGAEPATITLYTNEKKNPLSANITSQGAQGVTAQINTAFSEVLAEAAVGLAEDASAQLDDEETQASLDRLANRLESLSAQLNSGADTVSSLAVLVGSSVPLATGASELAASVDQAFGEAVAGAERGSAGGSSTSSDPFSAASSGLKESLDLASSNIAGVSGRLDALVDSAGDTAQSNAEVLDELAGAVDEQTAGFRATRDEIAAAAADAGVSSAAIEAFLADLDTAIARQESVSERLSSIAADLRSGVGADADARTAATEAVSRARAAIDAARTNFENSLQPQIDALRADLDAAASDAAVFRSHLSTVKSALSGSSGGMIALLEKSEGALEDTAQSMRDSAGRLDNALARLKDARSGGTFEEVAAALGADPQDLADLLSSPVAVERHAVFPVAGFGVGMAPLFSAIALWVGALLAGALLRVDVSENVGRRFLEANPRAALASAQAQASKDGETGTAPRVFTSAQEYWGRYVMFWLIGMAQSTLLMVGHIVFVDIQPVHPWLLLVAGWVISTVFTNIIYTLVISLANAGKAVAVVLLVLQISAAGGAYPLELLPQWFQNLGPWLPATYAINMMRSAIAGMYAGDYLRDMGMLLLFIIPNLILGLALRHPIANRVKKMTIAAEKTKVMAI